MIDLHTHTTCSDGTDTPRELVNKALSQGLSVLAITDHDTTSGWDEARQALRGNLELVLGAEVSCLTDDGISVHMLGLLFDETNVAMQVLLEETRDGRIPRMRKMIELMRAEGLDISLEDVEAVTPLGATLGRPHLADALVRNGFEELYEAGLNGIEVDHRDHSPAERDMLRAIAIEKNLVITGSSDYHGTGKMNSLAENWTSPEHWHRLESESDQRRVVKA